jgi:hypothetical protein
VRRRYRPCHQCRPGKTSIAALMTTFGAFLRIARLPYACFRGDTGCGYCKICEQCWRVDGDECHSRGWTDRRQRPRRVVAALASSTRLRKQSREGVARHPTTLRLCPWARNRRCRCNAGLYIWPVWQPAPRDEIVDSNIRWNRSWNQRYGVSVQLESMISGCLSYHLRAVMIFCAPRLSTFVGE